MDLTIQIMSPFKADTRTGKRWQPSLDIPGYTFCLSNEDSVWTISCVENGCRLAQDWSQKTCIALAEDRLYREHERGTLLPSLALFSTLFLLYKQWLWTAAQIAHLFPGRENSLSPRNFFQC